MLELDDIQSYVFQAFGKNYNGYYAFLRFGDDLGECLRWLRRQTEYIGCVELGTKRLDRNKKKFHLVIAFTNKGLKKIGFGGEDGNSYVSEFSEAFTTGMSGRADIIGDEPGEWEWGSKEQEVHIMLAMFAKKEEFSESTKIFQNEYREAGFGEVKVIEGYSYSDSREHFGFTDGISQPLIEGFHDSIDVNNICKSGEFVLGYLNERKIYPQAAVVEDKEYEDGFDLGKNGSFLVVRQLDQDVEKFREENKSELDAAKLIGRWRSGAPLTLCPNQDDFKLRKNNSFTYFDADRYGYRCPVGSHVRRSNPRDSVFALEETENPKSSQAFSKRHRIMRRGRMYGPPVAEDFYTNREIKDNKKSGDSRGTLFICLNASIETQFEFIMQNWINRKDFNGLIDEVDPLASVNDKITRLGPVETEEEKSESACPGRNFTSPQAPGVPGRKISQYVTMRGGDYFFLPGIRSLNYILSSTVKV